MPFTMQLSNGRMIRGTTGQWYLVHYNRSERVQGSLIEAYATGFYKRMTFLDIANLYKGADGIYLRDFVEENPNATLRTVENSIAHSVKLVGERKNIPASYVIKLREAFEELLFEARNCGKLQLSLQDVIFRGRKDFEAALGSRRVPVPGVWTLRKMEILAIR